MPKVTANNAAVNWEALYQHLEIARQAIDHGFVPSEAEKQQILKARAKRLAQAATAEESAQTRLRVITFQLAGAVYALELAYVHEVYALNQLIPVPCTPVFVRGIINIRGRIFSVISLAAFLGLPEPAAEQINQVIIVSGAEIEFGILAETILGVTDIPLAHIQSSLPTLTGDQGQYVRGLTTEPVVILDALKLLHDPRLVVNQTVEN